MLASRRYDVRLALLIALIQLAMSVILASGLWLLDPATGWAALVGGLTGGVASGVFALISLRQTASSGKMLLGFYLGEAVKLLVIVVSLTAVFKFLPFVHEGDKALALFGAFLLTQAAYIVAPSLVKQ